MSLSVSLMITPAPFTPLRRPDPDPAESLAPYSPISVPRGWLGRCCRPRGRTAVLRPTRPPELTRPGEGEKGSAPRAPQSRENRSLFLPERPYVCQTPLCKVTESNKSPMSLRAGPGGWGEGSWGSLRAGLGGQVCAGSRGTGGGPRGQVCAGPWGSEQEGVSEGTVVMPGRERPAWGPVAHGTEPVWLGTGPIHPHGGSREQVLSTAAEILWPGGRPARGPQSSEG